jgi:hypothetical protein
MYFENHPRAGVPGNFIFVELPYSQGPAFFTNLAIYHEIAHFVFEKLEADATEGSVVAELAQAMEAAFEANLGKQLPSAPNRTWAKEVLRAWTREVFCDLFACRFLGPAFMFALIDVLSLIGLMEEGTTAAIEFEKEHPAPALRLQEQVNQLRRDDWWQTVQDLPTDHVALSRRLAPRDDSHYEFIFNDTKLPGFIETFLKIVPYIHPVVESITPPSRTAAADFGKSASDIEKCFLHGVVPSHLSQQGSAKGPSQVSIVNAAYCFYLTSMPKLMDKIGEDPGKLDKRSELTAKLERVGRLKPLRTVSYTPLCGRDIELSVFSNAEISDRLSRKVEDPEGLVVTPLLDKEDALDADSIDLRLGTHFLLPRSLPEPYFAPDRNTATSLHLRVHVPLGRYLVVPAHQTVLGATLEFISCHATPPERFLLSPPWLARSSSSRQRRGFTRSTGAA